MLALGLINNNVVAGVIVGTVHVTSTFSGSVTLTVYIVVSTNVSSDTSTASGKLFITGGFHKMKMSKEITTKAILQKVHLQDLLQNS